MKTIRLTESDLRRIVIRTLKEQEQTPEPVSANNKVGNAIAAEKSEVGNAIAAEKSEVGNALKLTKLNNGVEISEEYLEEYKKVKLEISGDRKKVEELRKNLKLNGCIITGNPSSSLGNNGMTTFVSDYLIPTDLDYTSL